MKTVSALVMLLMLVSTTLSASEISNNRLSLTGQPGVVIYTVAGVSLPPATSGELIISLSIPDNSKLLQTYPGRYSIIALSGNSFTVTPGRQNGRLQNLQTMITFTTAAADAGLFEVHATYGYCEGGRELCIPRYVIWRVGYSISSGSDAYLELIDSP